jgi:hypothetical protein
VLVPGVTPPEVVVVVVVVVDVVVVDFFADFPLGAPTVVVVFAVFAVVVFGFDVFATALVVFTLGVVDFTFGGGVVFTLALVVFTLGLPVVFAFAVVTCVTVILGLTVVVFGVVALNVEAFAVVLTVGGFGAPGFAATGAVPMQSATPAATAVHTNFSRFMGLPPALRYRKANALMGWRRKRLRVIDLRFPGAVCARVCGHQIRHFLHDYRFSSEQSCPVGLTTVTVIRRLSPSRLRVCDGSAPSPAP